MRARKWLCAGYMATSTTAVVTSTRNASQSSCDYRDVFPDRSPIAVHKALLPLLQAKQIVEIGGRNGDDFCCYARVAMSAVLFERAGHYCNAVADRCARRFSGRSEEWKPLFQPGATISAPTGAWVVCSDYSKSTVVVDADLYLFWAYPGLTFNLRVMRFLMANMNAGLIRRTAHAVLMADLQLLDQRGNPDREDDLSRYMRHASWKADVPFDEQSACQSLDQCWRAKGRFRVVMVPLAAEGLNLSGTGGHRTHT